MADGPRYSIAVCNYNMVETVGESLRSMLDQVGDEFEVVVVDGGSTDGSREVIADVAAAYPNCRAVLDRADECDHLGGDRNISFQESRGEYVLESLDTDDRYHDGVIEDFVHLYHRLEDHREGDFFLSGRGINMAPRDLYFAEPYYDLGGAEDRDFWRRLIDRDALVWLEMGQAADQLGYEPDLRAKVGRDLEGKVCDFQSGVTLSSALRWTLHHEHHYVLEERRPLPLEFVKRCYDLVTLPYAYLLARGRERHAAPPGFRRKGTLEEWIVANRMTADELAAHHGFEMDWDGFSDAGRRAFQV
ncbi:MAG: glycosyltransferase family 2 protein [Halobacteriaceae archaeon]